MSRVRLVLVRHGESHWNVDDRYQGQLDSGLTEAGRAQAELAAEVLAGRYGRADLVLSSDLPRTRDTAAAYERLVGADVREDPRLREIDVGTWSGRHRAEVATAFPDEFAAVERGEDLPRGGGETYGQVRERVWAALSEAARAATGPVIVFTHGGPVRVATAAALRVPSERAFTPVANCSLTVIEHRGPDGTHALVAYNAPTGPHSRPTRVE